MAKDDSSIQNSLGIGFQSPAGKRLTQHLAMNFRALIHKHQHKSLFVSKAFSVDGKSNKEDGKSLNNAASIGGGSNHGFSPEGIIELIDSKSENEE